jgi:hypothetical protein
MKSTTKNRKLSKGSKFSNSASDIPVLILEKEKHQSYKINKLNSYKRYGKMMEMMDNINDLSINSKIPFEEFAKGIKSTMREYKIDIESNNLAGEQSIEISKPIKNQYIELFNKSFIRQNIPNISNHKISIDREEFKNPLDSFITIQHNKSIYNKLIKNSVSREINQFFNVFNKLDNSVTCNLKKVKVSNVFPKSNEIQNSGKSFKSERKFQWLN